MYGSKATALLIVKVGSMTRAQVSRVPEVISVAAVHE